MNNRSRLSGVRVLVVDDMRYVLDVVTDMLKSSGAEVTAVGSAHDALDVLQRERPDVLLSDLSMPGKGGYWLIGQVRTLPPERGGATPAAALTAYTTAEHRASVIRAGFQYHVAKPVGLRELVDVVAVLALKEQPSRPFVGSSVVFDGPRERPGGDAA
jgi:CheY-like chemotaxis protein